MDSDDRRVGTARGIADEKAARDEDRRSEDAGDRGHRMRPGPNRRRIAVSADIRFGEDVADIVVAEALGDVDADLRRLSGQLSPHAQPPLFGKIDNIRNCDRQLSTFP